MSGDRVVVIKRNSYTGGVMSEAHGVLTGETDDDCNPAVLIDGETEARFFEKWSVKNEAEYMAKKAQDAEKQAVPARMIQCACGHTIALELVMSTSSGTSCPDCYDRMSI